MNTPHFSIISGAVVKEVLRQRHYDVVRIVENAYLLHGKGQTVNPPSCFLRYPDRPDARTIALPASIAGEVAVDGIKWISSFPRNVAAGLPRASAVLILNDQETGYPFACLESSVISATRTAASAVLAADRLRPDRPKTVGFVGTGLIARYIHEFLTSTQWTFETTYVADTVPEYARAFAGHAARYASSGQVRAGTLEATIRSSDLVVFATTAAAPHIHDAAWFAHNPLVLHVSLRDLAPEVILTGTNVVDDVEHCLKADTSPHLAEQRTGIRSFIAGTLPDVLAGALVPAPDEPLFFSPFGLGVLDLAVGRFVYDEAVRHGLAHPVPNFFAELRRYG